MPSWSTVLLLPALLLSGLFALHTTESSAPPQKPQPAALAPLDAPRVALAHFDEASALLRADRFAPARRLLLVAAHELPSPYREQANVAAEQIRRCFLTNGAAEARIGSAEYFRARIDLAVYLGDFRAAADHSWRLAELDPARFARDGYAMNMLEEFLVWSECSVDELQKLVRLAIDGQPIESRRYYGDWGIRHDMKRLSTRTASSHPVSKMRAYFETTYDFQHSNSDTDSPRHAMFLLRTFLPVAGFTDAQKRALGDIFPRIAYRIVSALYAIGDKSGGDAWLKLAQRAAPLEDAPDATPEGLLRRAEESYQRRDFAAALADFRRVAALGQQQKSWGVAQFNVGICLKALKRHDEAEASFRELIGGDVDDTEPVSIMQWHRNYRSSAAIMIATCCEERGDFREANRWLVQGYMKYRVSSDCGTCEMQASAAFIRHWATNLLRAGPNDREREAIWLVLLSHNASVMDLGFLMVEDARSRRAAATLVREFDRRLKLPPVFHEARSPYPPPSAPDIVKAPDHFAAWFCREARWYGDSTGSSSAKLLDLRRIAHLAELEEADDRSALFRALINQPLGIYEIFWGTTREGIQFDRWYARQAAAYFLADPAKASRWLIEHAPNGPNEQAWHRALSATLGLPATIDLMEATFARVVSHRLSINSTRYQSIASPDADILRDMGFLSVKGKAELYARTKSLQELKPLKLFLPHDGTPQFLIELGR